MLLNSHDAVHQPLVQKKLSGHDYAFFSFIILWLSLTAMIRPLAVPDEGRYGGIARWMLVSQDWLVPRLNGMPFLHKPPLLYWLDAIFMYCFGVNGWVARFAPLLAAILMLIAVFQFIRKYFNIVFARKVILALAVNFIFYGCSQYINHDLLVAMGISIGILAFADTLLTGSRSSLLIGYTACAAAMLSKGLIGVLLPGMVLLPWIIAMGYWRKIAKLLHPIGIVWFLFLVLPWLCLMHHKFPEFLHYFFIEQQFNRFNGKVFNNIQAWYFYIAILVVSVLPWLFLINYKQIKQQLFTQLGKPIAYLMLWWLFSMVVFFSIPASKLFGYIAPAIVPLVVIVVALVEANPGKKKWATCGGWMLLAVGLLLVSMTKIPKMAVKVPAQHHQALFVLGGIVCILAVVLLQLYRQNKLSSVRFTYASLFLICTVIPFAFKYADHANNADQLSFTARLPVITPDTQLVFEGYYQYDIPFLLQLTQPVAAITDWQDVGFDTWQQQFNDGERFEPETAQPLLWYPKDIAIKLAQKKRFVLLSSDAHEPALEGHVTVSKYRNFTVYDTACDLTNTCPKTFLEADIKQERLKR